VLPGISQVNTGTNAVIWTSENKCSGQSYFFFANFVRINEFFDWIELVHITDSCLALLNAVINFRVA
jgi:hypothetical protein